MPLFYRPLTIGLLCTIAQTATAANATKPPLNGWYPCSEITFSDPDTRPPTQVAECAVYSAPLCYPGICEAPASADPTVDIFVKRVPATVGDVATAPNVWFIQGGPGFSSVNMEQRMLDVHAQMGGSINAYTMDHRGTGRSTRLDCVAAQAMTSASPGGQRIEPSEVPSCAKDLHVKYGDLASFSTTSAASDLSTFISDYTNGANTFVYGVSYGTALVERLMHLKTPSVKGFILDGIMSSSGASAGKFEYFSKFDADYGEVGEYFMGLCALDAQCKSHFKSANLSSALRDLVKKFDDDRNSTCASLTNSEEPDMPPSYLLRFMLGSLLRRASTRTLIPPVVHRLSRCNENDVKVMTKLFKSVPTASSSAQDDTHFSYLLYHLIVYSEMWETPAPSRAEMESRMNGSSIVTRATYRQALPLYCAMTKEKSAACDEFNFSKYEADGIVYRRDQYWNKAATLSSDASVLLLSGKLDTQTPHKYAEYLLEALGTSKKELVSFDYAQHETLYSTLLGDGTNPTLTCGLELLKSYISNDGDLKRLNKTCVREMPALNLTVPTYQLHNLLSTDEAYDGEYKPDLSST